MPQSAQRSAAHPTREPTCEAAKYGKSGEPALNFYAVERGELEVVRHTDDGTEEIVAVLAQGDFFGEMALLEQRERSASVRARSDAEVTVLGVQVFARLTKALAPLKRSIVEAARKRSPALATRMPQADAVLDTIRLEELIEAPPSPTIQTEVPLRDVLALMADKRLELVYVANGAQQLAGVLTRSDLLRAVDAALALPFEQRHQMKVGEVMSPAPAAVTRNDSARTAANLLWERGLKTIPVVANAESREVVGCIRIETLLHAVVGRLAGLRAASVRASAEEAAGGRPTASPIEIPACSGEVLRREVLSTRG